MSDVSVEIIADCQRGDREAQERLVEVCQRTVFQLVVHMVGAADAADVSQQVFLRVFLNIAQFSGRSRFETWLYRITINECLQHVRRESRHKNEPLIHDPHATSASHTAQVEHRDLMQEALDRLEPELRAIFVLREFQGLSYREIAASVGLSEGTAASRLSRTRRKLKQLLIELGWDD